MNIQELSQTLQHLNPNRCAYPANRAFKHWDMTLMHYHLGTFFLVQNLI